MQIRKTVSVYILLGLAWALIAGWQTLEHVRFVHNSRVVLRDRAREIGNTLSVVIRSQGRFGMVQKDRLEAALDDLATSRPLQAVMLLNSQNEVVAKAGKQINLPPEDLIKQSEHWDQDLVTFINPISLDYPLLLTEGRGPGGFSRGGGPGSPGDRPNFSPPPPGSARPDEMTSPSLRQRFLMMRQDRPTSASAAGPGQRRRSDGDRRDSDRRDGRRPPNFPRPFGMTEQRYQELLKEKGLHGFVIQMALTEYSADLRQDLWIRFTTAFIALLAVGGMGFAWRNMERMNRLQIRLLRASELNAHLQDLNIAAAGLAHETRNPLNIVRGLAHMITQQTEASGEIRQKASEITAEVDRVTGRLNEFINYSRYPEPHPAPTNLMSVVADVERALDTDLAEKLINFSRKGPAALTVEADEALLRQVLFNLMLNATQAVSQGGKIAVTIHHNGRGEASLEVSDDGPGVPPNLENEIFKPYFTTRLEGTGLGLAVVRQIVLAHHWEIEYVSSIHGGAGFRVSGLKVL